MDSEEAVKQLEEAVRQRKAAEDQLKEARTAIANAIVALLKNGKEPKEIAPIAGVSYEKVRTLARAHDIKRLREPTVRSVKDE
jgi:predicted RNA-binding protein associated with RNAse of E/G family